MKRREFFNLTAISVLSLSQPIFAAKRGKPKRPNVLFIMTDQQFADALILQNMLYIQFQPDLSV